METLQAVARMTDDEVLSAFGTAEDADGRGFDDATYARVLAYELVRARGRVAYYRALYDAFVDAGKPFMIENLDDVGDGDGIPAKLVFADDPDHVRGLEESAAVVVWTEPELLRELARELDIEEFFTGLLDELAPLVVGA